MATPVKVAKTESWDVCFDAAVEVARKAGEEIRSAFSSEKRIETKSCAVDLVTETDQKVEKMIISTLREKFPTHSFIGEESAAAGEKVELTDNPTWIIDPVDGTTNFVHGFPFVAVSIALSVNKEVVVGVVYNAILDQMFTGQLGKGAFMNGKPIHVSGQEELSQSLLISEFGSSRDKEKMDLVFSNLGSFLNENNSAHGCRFLGSAALDMCQIAIGGGDMYFQFGIHVWDIAAGALIIREAGGVVWDTSGGPFDMMSRRVLCASSVKLARTIAEGLTQMELERD
ncbi:PREDICTED: inositol monophosphatase 1-like isoform X2 [Branchiostoma belcheri]|uniref:Inositol-1-monophosphatase n=1 Tax=Branchiostoma belcheri TaxID=7741 RepID=A0A6P4ZF52_BRABE|nr:PREDICTED: inositol monophosphatase 1-like isoform X2 [Branchiostoma belcheri]